MESTISTKDLKAGHQSPLALQSQVHVRSPCQKPSEAHGW